jgi:hypothetical protein
LSRPRGLALILLVAFLAQPVIGLWHGLEVQGAAPAASATEVHAHECPCEHESAGAPAPAPCDDGCSHDPSSCNVCRTLLLLTHVALVWAPPPTMTATGPVDEADPLPDFVIRRASVRVAHPRGPPTAA